MASFSGPPPGLTRPKTSKETLQPPPFSSSPCSLSPPIASPTPRRPQSTSWASSLAAGLFPPTFEFPPPAQVPQCIQPLNEAVHPAGCLPHPPQTLLDNTLVTDLAVFPAPSPSDPWHMAHLRVCAHASATCSACSAAFVCCSCRALRFTPGTPPIGSLPSSQQPGPSQRSRSASPALFRLDVGNGTPPPGFDSHCDGYDDDAYAQAIADSDNCDNSSCPRGTDEPATYTITVEQFDEGSEEFYDRTYCVCAACNRACKKSFLGNKIKSRQFDNSARAKVMASRQDTSNSTKKGNRNEAKNPAPCAFPSSTHCRTVPGSASYAAAHPLNPATSPKASTTPVPRTSSTMDSGNNLHQDLPMLQDALRALNVRPPTPAAFVATIRVKHDASCKRLHTPAVARHLACKQCQHIAHSCCQTAFCCKCGKPWLPSDSVLPFTASIAQRFRGGAGSGTVSSPEPDIWTPSPRSSPDEIDDLTAHAALPLPASRSESDASRAPSRASSVDMPVNVAATPLPTPDFSSLDDDAVDGLIHPSFPDRAILDTTDKRHFLGRGDLSVTSLKLYARRIFSETSHWITAGHFLIDIFQGSTLNGSRDDFRRFVILVGTHLGFGDLALSMSESLDVNRKMADEYMRLRDVATTWKQKAKANNKDARDGRKAQDELSKARGDISAILEEREN
ncbi:hypothetical protein AX14_007000 [Amanita brunnescens Koide BX004]|nr:hypothetical protein AX14_007000 [Amanita brunnescens Koide BX004]